MESNKEEHTTSIAKLALLFLAMALFALWLAYDASAAIPPEPELYWSIDNTHLVGDAPTDLTSNNNNGTKSGSYTSGITGIIAEAINFTGSGRVEKTSFGITAYPITWSWWAHYDSSKGTTTNQLSLADSGSNTAALYPFFNAGKVVQYQIYSGTQHAGITGVMTGRSDGWHHFFLTHESGNITLWIDGVQVNQTTDATAVPGGLDKFCIGGLCRNSPSNTDGPLDEVAIWNVLLGNEEAELMYNFGAGCQYPFTACGVVNTTVNFTAIDIFNSTPISNFSVNISWGNGTVQTETTTTGGVYLDLGPNNASLTANISYYNATDYFNLTLTGQAITANTSTTITASMTQAIATLQAFEILTNNSLSGVTFYINGSSGTVFNLTAGTHSVIAEKAGYYNLTSSITVAALTNTTYNIEGLYNSIANFSATNALSGAAISSFSVDLSTGNSYSTSNGSVEVPLLNNTAYSLNLTATNFTSVTNYNFTINKSYQNVSVPAWVLNSIRINIFNESSGLLLNTTTVTIHAISNFTSTTNTTTTGFIQLGLLTPSDYELRFEAPNFNPRSVFLSVINDSAQNITVYLTENTTTEIQVIEVLDTSNSPIEGAVVWLQKQKLNTSDQWITIQEAQTDYNGKTSVYVERDTTIFYRFAVIYEGSARPIQPTGNLFTGPTSFIPGVTETIQLIVNLESEPTDFLSDDLAISYNVTWVNNDTINFTWLDGRNSITGAILQIEASYINESLAYTGIVNLTATGTFGYINYTIPYINNSIWRVTAYISFANSDVIVWSGVKRFDINVIIEKNTGLIYAIFILLIVALLTVTLGPLPSGLITIGALVPLTYLKFISIPTTIITSLLALVIIFFLRTRKLDE